MLREWLVHCGSTTVKRNGKYKTRNLAFLHIYKAYTQTIVKTEILVKGGISLKKFLSILPLLFLLTGCWDQNIINQTKLITAEGIDYSKDGKVVSTVAVPQAVASDVGKGNIADQVISASGHTVRQSMLRLDRKISESLDLSKNQVLVISEFAAKKDIYHFLDIFYRDPKSALNAKLVISKGNASSIISTRFSETQTSSGVGEYLKDLIISAEENGTVIDENIQTICPKMFDPGQDFAIPFLEAKKDTVKINGVALFHENKMVGRIKEPLSVVFTMLSGEASTKAMSTTKRIYNNQKMEVLNYVTVKLEKNDRALFVNVTPAGKISAHIKLKLRATLTEYPHANLSKPSEVTRIERALSKKFSADAQEVIDRLQKMNSDPFGVGRHLIAFHYPAWEKLNWAKEYQKIDFTASVDIELASHGIIE